MAFRANKRLLHFSLEYGTLLVLLAGGLLYHNATAFRDRCVRVEGVVVEQVGAQQGLVGETKPRPVFRYSIDGEIYQAVPPDAEYPTGAHALLLALREQPHSIYVYDASYWVSFGFDTFPIFLFGGVAYAVLIVHSQRLRRQLAVLAEAEARLAGTVDN